MEGGRGEGGILTVFETLCFLLLFVFVWGDGGGGGVGSVLCFVVFF